MGDREGHPREGTEVDRIESEGLGIEAAILFKSYESQSSSHSLEVEGPLNSNCFVAFDVSGDEFHFLYMHIIILFIYIYINLYFLCSTTAVCMGKQWVYIVYNYWHGMPPCLP